MIRSLLALATLSALSSFAQSQILPNAGPDQVVSLSSGALLAGSIANRTPLDYWTADGNFATENCIVMYHEGAPNSASPVLHDSTGLVYGWPSDLQEIGGQVYGIESLHRRLYTVDVASGLCTPIGTANTWKNVYCLAYDALGDRLFGVDLLKKQLLKFNRTTGKVTAVGVNTLKGYPLVRALAFRPADGFLYAVDQGTDKLLKLNPLNGQVTIVRQLPPDPLSRIEELEFRDDRLYATLGLQNANQDLLACQLQRIDIVTGAIVNLGPVIDSVSPHSLVIHSVPEDALWSQRSGPGLATFVNPTNLDSSVIFSQPGVYELDLTVFTSGGPLSDTVLVDVQ